MLSIFYVEAQHQLVLSKELKPLRQELEALVGDTVTIIFHTTQQCLMHHQTFLAKLQCGHPKNEPREWCDRCGTLYKLLAPTRIKQEQHASQEGENTSNSQRASESHSEHGERGRI